jgi:hypothetical protein
MKHIIKLIFFPLLLFPIICQSATTDGCHCFRNRTFDQADKFAADEYLLATTYNSLTVATLDITKRQIVMKKMSGGINGDDLLIGLYVQKMTSKPLDVLLSIRDNGGSWQDIMQAPGIDEKMNSDPILAAISSGTQPKEVTRLITDFMIRDYYKCSPEEIQSLTPYNLSDKETALLFALKKQTGTSFAQLIKMSQSKKMSWSEIAHHFKLEPAQVGKNIIGE